MKKIIEKILRSLERLDWENFDEVESNNKKILENIFNNGAIIGFFLKNVLRNADLISLAEHYDFFDKIVLYVDKKDRFRIRIHIFSNDDSNKYRPHCHRWIYSSVILKGSYKHFIYGTENEINENTDINNLKPILSQEEKVGSIYTLNHNAFHSIGAMPDTVSFMIRGPAVKDRFLIIDKKVNKKWWEYGRESETIEEIKNKSISEKELKRLRDKLYKMNLFS